MQKTCKGTSKIFVLFLVIAILVISAIVFGYSNENTDEIELRPKTHNVIDEDKEINRE